MKLTLPWPPAKSSPNGPQGDFYGKAAAGKKYKNACLLECIAQKLPRKMSSVSCVTFTFHPPKAYRYDLDNALARMKRGLDAISDHIGVDDADWQEMRLKRGGKVKGGCVIVEIEE